MSVRYHELSTIFEHQLIKEFKEKNMLKNEDIEDYLAELLDYISDPKNHKLIYINGYVELIKVSTQKNPGILYLGEPYFFKDIQIKDIDYSNNPSKSLFLNAYLKNDNKNYFLTGSNGIGKTFLSIALANLHYEQTKEKTLYVFWPDFIEKSKDFSSNNSKIINDVKHAKRLIIDDLGQESISQWGRDDVLNPIISYRLERNLTTLITSNYSFSELRDLYVLRPIDAKKAKSILNKVSGHCPVYIIQGVDLRNENTKIDS